MCGAKIGTDMYELVGGTFLLSKTENQPTAANKNADTRLHLTTGPMNSESFGNQAGGWLRDEHENGSRVQ